MDLGADTEGTHHGPGFGSITEEGSGMAADREGEAGGTGPPPGGRQLKVGFAWI